MPMPTIAILADIHSNLIAFKAVLKDVMKSGAERIIFLGDIVGYGSHPAECVDLVRKLGGECVMGNHDEEIKVCRKPGFQFADPDWRENDYAAGLVHSSQHLNEGQAAWIAGLPYWLQIPGGVVAHASLDHPTVFNYIEDEESAAPTLALLKRCPQPVGFFGHTHIQRVFTEPGQSVEWHESGRFTIPQGVACAVTVGSVGQPRQPNDLRACWALWDPETRTVELRRVHYDRVAAARQVVAAGLPLDGALRLLAPGEEKELLVG